MLRNKLLLLLILLSITVVSFAQDTTVIIDKKKITLPEVLVRTNFDYKTLLSKIKEDTTFYKAFRNLRILNYTSLNDIKMYDKKGSVKASLYSRTQQHRNRRGCRTMQVLEEKATGDMYKKDHSYNYFTPELYAALFFTKDSICGEDNIVKDKMPSTRGKSGTEKHKEQLKMLFFNPGKKVPGVPFIGNKLDLYDDDARKLYDYKLETKDRNGQSFYVFSIMPKEDLGFFKKDKVVVDEMVTWFDLHTLEVMERSYVLSYSAGVYSFEVSMFVEMTKVGNLTVPKTLRYKGDWDIILKKKERGTFTATLFNFKVEN